MVDVNNRVFKPGVKGQHVDSVCRCCIRRSLLKVWTDALPLTKAALCLRWRYNLFPRPHFGPPLLQLQSLDTFLSLNLISISFWSTACFWKEPPCICSVLSSANISLKIYSSQGWNVRLFLSKLWFAMTSLLGKTAVHGCQFKSRATAGTVDLKAVQVTTVNPFFLLDLQNQGIHLEGVCRVSLWVTFLYFEELRQQSERKSSFTDTYIHLSRSPQTAS